MDAGTGRATRLVPPESLDDLRVVDKQALTSYSVV